MNSTDYKNILPYMQIFMISYQGFLCFPHRLLVADGSIHREYGILNWNECIDCGIKPSSLCVAIDPADGRNVPFVAATMSICPVSVS